MLFRPGIPRRGGRRGDLQRCEFLTHDGRQARPKPLRTLPTLIFGAVGQSIKQGPHLFGVHFGWLRRQDGIWQLLGSAQSVRCAIKVPVATSCSACREISQSVARAPIVPLMPLDPREGHPRYQAVGGLRGPAAPAQRALRVPRRK